MSFEMSDPQTHSGAQQTTTSIQQEPDHPGSAVWIARFSWFIAIAGAIGALALFHMSGTHATVFIAAQIPGIILLGIVVDTLMRKNHARIHRER